MHHRCGQEVEQSSTLDRVYRTLSHPVRRRILLALQTDAPRRVEEFATESATPGSGVRAGAVGLHHVHLPRLDEAGFVDWEEESEMIRKGHRFEEVRPHLELLREQW
jgi:predicted transcriptional regulator